MAAKRKCSKILNVHLKIDALENIEIVKKDIATLLTSIGFRKEQTNSVRSTTTTQTFSLLNNVNINIDLKVARKVNGFTFPIFFSNVTGRNLRTTETKLTELVLTDKSKTGGENPYNTPNRLLEVVVPFKADSLDYFGIDSSRKYLFPGVYCVESMSNESNQHVYIRKSPIHTLALVILVPNLNDLKAKLHSLTLSHPLTLETIGKRASFPSSNHEQIQIVSPLLLPGLDLRLTESSELKPYFNEGPNAVLERTISSIQSNRIFGGDSNLKEDKVGSGCWSEIHAIMWEKLKDTLSIDSVKQNKRAAGSFPIRSGKNPSLIE
mmetsp:Transcript_4050/g.6064  ORF Transcript_4050/g.6064 Transcript_4050/m.6064 type:complete len:322 (-) Transcript_4050:46-1011(-)